MAHKDSTDEEPMLLSVGGMHGEVVIEGRIVSVKITPDRTVWYKWNEHMKQFSSTERKVQKNMSRSMKEHFLLNYRNLLLDEYKRRGEGSANIRIHDSSGEDEESDSYNNSVEVKN